jgi:hypothetical protein
MWECIHLSEDRSEWVALVSVGSEPSCSIKCWESLDKHSSYLLCSMKLVRTSILEQFLADYEN